MEFYDRKKLTIDDIRDFAKNLDEQLESIHSNAKNGLIYLCEQLGESAIAERVKNEGLPTSIILPDSTPDYFFAGLCAMLSHVQTRVQKTSLVEKITFAWMESDILGTIRLDAQKRDFELREFFSFFY